MKSKAQIKKKKLKASTNMDRKFRVVVTQKKSNSWAEDLYACERKPYLDRVYN